MTSETKQINFIDSTPNKYLFIYLTWNYVFFFFYVDWYHIASH